MNDDKLELTVWEGPMPESNGKSNFTAVLMRKGAGLFDGISGGIVIARSEYPDRVRYEADRVRYLIGELDSEPFILDYDADKHSGYVEPLSENQQEPVAWVNPKDLVQDGYSHTFAAYSEQYSGFTPLYTKPSLLKDRNVTYSTSTQQAPARQVPEGWQLVPVEPTPEMAMAIKAQMELSPVTWCRYRAAARAMLAAAPQAEQDNLDQRMKDAGMLSVTELLAGAPLDSFVKHVGVKDLDTFAEWLEMRRAECLKQVARYDLGERKEGDDLYEWAIAHAAVFSEVHINFKAVHKTTKNWMSMDTAPKDGTLIRLLVEFDDYAIEDEEGPLVTIGMNQYKHTDEDVWQFVGWDWSQDCFTGGLGNPIGWLPMLESQHSSCGS